LAQGSRQCALSGIRTELCFMFARLACVPLLACLCSSHGQHNAHYDTQASFLQLAVTIAENVSSPDLETQSDLHGLISSLLQAKKVCPRATEDCLPILTDLRKQLWPRVQNAANWSGGAWLPLGIDSEQAIGTVPCSASNDTTLYYRHIWKSAGHNVFENLEQISTAYRQNELSCTDFCEDFLRDGDVRKAAFTFVRDPITRFISGYAEIEHRIREGQYTELANALSGHAQGSRQRAAAFFEEFLRDGVGRDGHVKPQLEFMIPCGGCSVPLDFLGRVENMENDWKRLLVKQDCTASAFDAFDDSLGLHPNDVTDKLAMEKVLGVPLDDVTLAPQESEVISLAESTDMNAIVLALRQNSARYLNALCWLLLPDFVAFGYELPLECSQALVLHRYAKSHT